MRDQLNNLKLPANPDGSRRLPPLLAEENALLDRAHEILWVLDDWYDATRGRKLGGMDGPDLLSHEKLVYWQMNRRIRVEPWQITAMLDIDATYVREALTPLESDKGAKE